MNTRIAAAAAAACLTVIPGATRTAGAQVVVQQPAVGVFGVRTVVSVPDRGGAVLGGVSRAGSSRVTHGPFRSGTSTGAFREHSAVGVRVWIHDLDAMDRELLRQGAGAPRGPSVEPRRDDVGDHAYRSLLARWPERPSVGHKGRHPAR